MHLLHFLAAVLLVDNGWAFLAFLHYDDTSYHGHGTGGVEMRGMIGTVLPDTIRFQTGDIRSRKVRMVCRKCNSEWMSRIKQKAKPRLLPLIQGEWPDLDANDQKTIATWAVMFTMVLELLDPRTDAHSFEERNTFPLLCEPPPGWFVWIGQARTGHGLFGITAGASILSVLRTSSHDRMCKRQHQK